MWDLENHENEPQDFLAANWGPSSFRIFEKLKYFIERWNGTKSSSPPFGRAPSPHGGLPWN